jgi:hypothetical protein
MIGTLIIIFLEVFIAFKCYRLGFKDGRQDMLESMLSKACVITDPAEKALIKAHFEEKEQED